MPQTEHELERRVLDLEKYAHLDSRRSARYNLWKTLGLSAAGNYVCYNLNPVIETS